MGMFKFLKNIGTRIRTLFSKGVDESVLQSLEHLFYEADLGAALSKDLVSYVRTLGTSSQEEILTALRKKLLSLLPPTLPQSFAHPHVILLVGVNGSGKTTSVIKLAAYHQKAQRKVLIAACDTFRAAATEQLERWTHSLPGIEFVKSQRHSDPSAIAFDALEAAKARKCDLVLIDTAGRLQTKTELMQELAKIRRICQKQIPDAPHETLLVLDATTGQNALDQAALFHQYTPLTGLILTKLDGTAKGGMALALQAQGIVPVRWIGTGEQITDLEPFDPSSFVDALLEIKK